MKSTFLVYKPVGLTPLQVIKKLKTYYPELAELKLGYAGRLDPMAEGLLLILVGDENKQKVSYEQLDKKYYCRALLGVGTDTHDLLGVVGEYDLNLIPQDVAQRISRFFTCYPGVREQGYPVYSSKRINGKPLFYWARQNKLHDLSIPTHEVTIYSISLERMIPFPSEEIKKMVFERINLVTSGDFRKNHVLNAWAKFFDKNVNKQLEIVSFTVHCSSGTYVRSIVAELGDYLNTKATCLSLVRTKIGDFESPTIKLP